jgi:hypothetical protein
MLITGFHCWGFVGWRTAPYNDANDQLWTTFLERIRADTESLMTRKPPGRPSDVEIPALLLPLMRRDVLEDPEHALVGPDIDRARRLFSTLRDTASAERNGEGAGHLFVELAESLNRSKKLPPIKVRVVNAGPSAYSLEKFLPPRSEDDEDDGWM